MDAAEWQPPDADRALGLSFYATQSAPVSGVLKQSSEDFEVHELSLYPVPQDDGPFTVLRIESRDWEQHELAQEVERALHLRTHALAWAGTKDRRAVSDRLFSYRGAPPARLPALPRVRFLEVYRARDGLVLGHHFGNSFLIRVTGLSSPAPAAALALSATARELRALGGFPNFFGPQRFGEVRPVTHEVGRALVRGDVAGAVELYLCAPSGGEQELGAEARRQYAGDHDAARALAAFPPAFRFERQLLEHLARGHPPERAFRALSRELRLLFVHAYQSLLFNRWLGLRRVQGFSLQEPAPGDFLLRVRRDGTVPGTDAIPVEPDNLPECRTLVDRGGARLAGPLIGYDTPRASGGAGELVEELLRQESLSRENFRIPAAPEVASRGSFRPAFVPLPPVGLRAPTAPETSPSAELVFALPKGTYATVLLREFLKPGASFDGGSKRGY